MDAESRTRNAAVSCDVEFSDGFSLTRSRHHRDLIFGVKRSQYIHEPRERHGVWKQGREERALPGARAVQQHPPNV